MKSNVVQFNKCVKNEKGFTLVELIVAMAIMSVLMAMYYSLFFSGGRHYEIVHDSYKKQNEARIAMSFITTKIRQNDLIISDTQAVSVQEDPDKGKYLRIETLDDDDNPEYEYIYKSVSASGDIKLMTSQTSPFDPAGSVIADGLYDIIFDKKDEGGNTCIIVKISYDSTDRGELEETVALRAK